MKPIRSIVALASLSAALGVAALVLRPNDPHVGDKTRDGIIVATGQAVQPTGRTAITDGGIVDAVMLKDGYAAVKHRSGVALFRLSDGKIVAQMPLKNGASLTGIAASPDQSVIAASDAQNGVVLWTRKGETLTELKTIKLPDASVGGAPYPCGLLFLDRNRIAAAANRDNSVFTLDVDTGTVLSRIPVGVAPYGLCADGERLYATCWSRPKVLGQPSADSSGTAVPVDKRGIGRGGLLWLVGSGPIASLPQQPTEVVRAGDVLYVACANGDVVEAISLRDKNKRLPLGLPGVFEGAAPNSLSVDLAQKRLLVAYGGLDRIGAFSLVDSKFQGFLRTAWYPTVVRCAPEGLLISTAKGIGSLAAAGKQHRVADLTGTVSFDPMPKFTNDYPAQPSFIPRGGLIPLRPVPADPGEPTPIKHVVYVIKENRTYDQVFGDIKGANGDPSLALYGEDVTPNHHALAREFALLDNYYCNGINSADGHAWTTEGNATTFFERSHGGWTRSYPFGDDPLATSSSGYIWDDALDHGKTVHNFGEFDYATPEPNRSWTDLYDAFSKGEDLHFKPNIGVERIRKLSEPDYPGWNLGIPDIIRADRFVKRLHTWDKAGQMPDLTILYLPQDHTSGGQGGMPTPRAHIADNDLALGRCVEAITKSRFWASTVVFVIEDDPQDGFDHVDGHRSLCLVVSPYTKRGRVISRFYNQTSVLRTIEHILGLPPMNRNDATANLMSDCFQPTPDLRPYVAKQNRIPLNELNPKGNELALRFDRPDQVDADRLNRTLWRLAGKKIPYPANLAGGHRDQHSDSDDD